MYYFGQILGGGMGNSSFTMEGGQLHRDRIQHISHRLGFLLDLE